MKHNSDSVVFNVISDLDSPKITLILRGIKAPLTERSIVIYLPGHRHFGVWGPSEPFQGAFQYFGTHASTEKAEKDISELARWISDGFAIGVSTFDDKRGPLTEIVDSVEIEVSGLVPHTCEKAIERHTFSMLDTHA